MRRYSFAFLFCFALCTGAPVLHALVNGANADNELGQFDSATDQITFHKIGINNTPNNRSFGSPIGSGNLAVDTVRHRLFFPDTINHRILVYSLDSSDQLIDNYADYVLGQPNLDSNSPATTQSGLKDPASVAIDSAGGRLFVADQVNHRVLVYDITNLQNGMNATHVIGQPDFTTGTSGLSSTKMNFPAQVAYDPNHDRLFVVDNSNQRVLVFDASAIADGMAASFVIGEADFVTAVASTSQHGVFTPYGVAYDTNHNRLFVADTHDNRVLVFDGNAIATNMNASFVIGQNDYSSGGGAVSQKTLNLPWSVEYDTVHDRLFVSDWNAHRVLVFNGNAIATNMNASFVLGQPDFTLSTQAVTQSNFAYPTGTGYDPTTNLLYVNDTGDSRIMVYDLSSLSNGMNASNELGQFTSADGVNYTEVNVNKTSKKGLDTPAGAAIDNSGHRLFLCDGANNRVLVYNMDASNHLLDNLPDHVIGQADFTHGSSSTTATTLNGPFGAAYDATSGFLFVSDHGNNRILVYDTSLLADGMSASYVLGQTNFVAKISSNTDHNFNGPVGISVDSRNRRLFVADESNNRVLVFNISTLANGQSATNVLGQPTFSSSTALTTQAGMSGPSGVAYYDPAAVTSPIDARQLLFVSDLSNNRVLIYNVTPGITNGMNAINVLGQADFTSGVSGATQKLMTSPIGVSIDPQNLLLYVPSGSNKRVLIYNLASISNNMDAQNVLGQSDFTSTTFSAGQSHMWPQSAMIDPKSQYLYVSDMFNRVMIFNTLNSPLSGTTPPDTHVGSIVKAHYPKIITPNGDGVNDISYFQLNNPNNESVTGKVFDINAAKVADMTAGATVGTTLKWDGKDSHGTVVRGGTYFFQIQVGGSRVSGTIVVAR